MLMAIICIKNVSNQNSSRNVGEDYVVHTLFEALWTVDDCGSKKSQFSLGMSTIYTWSDT